MGHAIKAATSVPARMLGLTTRGKLKKGFVADILVFDPDKIKDMATFDKPHQYSKGIEFLLINGQIVIEKGLYNGKRVGKTLRRNKDF